MLAVDFGTKRIGLAVGEMEFKSVSRRRPLQATGSLAGDAQEIIEVARLEGVAEIVVGLPLNPEGSSRMETICRRLADQIRALGWTVYLVDERLTSVEGAANIEGHRNRKKRHKKLDSEAAAIILERYFDAQK
jgi:putative Holliday junction resolvase